MPSPLQAFRELQDDLHNVEERLSVFDPDLIAQIAQEQAGDDRDMELELLGIAEQQKNQLLFEKAEIEKNLAVKKAEVVKSLVKILAPHLEISPGILVDLQRSSLTFHEALKNGKIVQKFDYKNQASLQAAEVLSELVELTEAQPLLAQEIIKQIATGEIVKIHKSQKKPRKNS